jgi:Zn ribbon nucleic-acid-binding protein
MASHQDHRHRWTSDRIEANHCIECGAVMEQYVAKLEQETALLRARRAHVNVSTMEAIETNERLARKNMALQARLARALEIVQAMAERQMPRYSRERDAWVCDSCDQEGQSHHPFQHQASCVWEQARTLLAEEGIA